MGGLAFAATLLWAAAGSLTVETPPLPMVTQRVRFVTDSAAASPVVPAASPSAGPPTVGALFASPTTSIHTCSASVVTSPGGDLVATAAHCVQGTGAGMVFAPGYDRGREPYGGWDVVAAYAPVAWVRRQDPRDDVALLVVAPRQVDGVPTSLQSVTGSETLGGRPRSGQRVTVDAYVAGDGDAPVICTARVYDVGVYPAFDCPGYAGGTSGGPWLLTRRDGVTVLSGVIGGLHRGGCLPGTSYSPPFGPVVRDLYDAAVRHAPPSVLPRAGPAGC